MNLEQMKAEYEAAKLDHQNCKTSTARSGVSEAIRKLKDKIYKEEHRLNSTLKTVVYQGKEYKLPYCLHFDQSKHSLYQEGEVIYILNQIKRNEAGEYHVWHNIWIPQREDKFVELTIRTLGGDRFGDRYFLDASYYKHPADQYPYMNKGINCANHGYKPYYTYVLNKLGLKQKKDRWENNRLEWVNQNEIGEC